MEQRLPFPVSTRPWQELSEQDLNFFSFAGDYLPLPASHAAQISLLDPPDARRVEV
jgi:hypothetical protein